MPQVAAGCAGPPGLRRTQDCVAFRPQQSCVVQAHAPTGCCATTAQIERRSRRAGARTARPAAQLDRSGQARPLRAPSLAGPNTRRGDYTPRRENVERKRSASGSGHVC